MGCGRRLLAQKLGAARVLPGRRQLCARGLGSFSFPARSSPDSGRAQGAAAWAGPAAPLRGAPHPHPAAADARAWPLPLPGGYSCTSSLVAKMVTVNSPPPLPPIFKSSVRPGLRCPPQGSEIQKAATIPSLVITLEIPSSALAPFFLGVIPLPRLLLTCSRIVGVLSENGCIGRPQVCTLQQNCVSALERAQLCSCALQVQAFLKDFNFALVVSCCAGSGL